MLKKRSFWDRASASLAELFHKLPQFSPLKLEIFLSFPTWKKEDWDAIIIEIQSSEDKLFHILVDDRSVGHIQSEFIIPIILQKKVSTLRCQRLIEKYDSVLAVEKFVVNYLTCLTNESFPPVETKKFLIKLSQTPHRSLLPDEAISMIGVALKKLKKHDPYSLFDLCIPLSHLESRFDETKRKPFFDQYFSLLPASFRPICSPEQKTCLGDLIEKYSIETPASVCIALTDTKEEKIEAAFRVMMKHQFFKNDAESIKNIIRIFLNLITIKHELYDSLSKTFIEIYLTDNKNTLSSEAFDSFDPGQEPELKHFYLIHSLNLPSNSFIRNEQKIIKQIRDLMELNRDEILKEIISHPLFKDWADKASLKQVVGEYFLKILQFKEEMSLEQVKNTLDWSLKICQICHFKEDSLDKAIPKWGQLIGSALYKFDEWEDLTHHLDKIGTLISTQCKGVKKKSKPTSSQRKSRRTKQSASSATESTPEDLNKRRGINLSLSIIDALVDKFAIVTNEKQVTTLAEKVVHHFKHLLPKSKSIPTSHVDSVASFYRFVERFVSCRYLDPDEFQCRKKIANLLTEMIVDPFFDSQSLLLLKTSNLCLKPTSNKPEIIEKNLLLFNPINLSLISNSQFIKLLGNKEITRPHNQPEMTELKKYFCTSTYLVNPAKIDRIASLIYKMFTNPEFARLSDLYPDDYRSWILFLKHPSSIDHDADLYTQGLTRIMNDFPKVYLEGSFFYLIDLFKRYLLQHDATITPAFIQCLLDFLNLYAITTLSRDDLYALGKLFTDLHITLSKKDTTFVMMGPLIQGILKWQNSDLGTESSCSELQLSFFLYIFTSLLNSPHCDQFTDALWEGFIQGKEFLQGMKLSPECSNVFIKIIQMESNRRPIINIQGGSLILNICSNVIETIRGGDKNKINFLIHHYNIDEFLGSKLLQEFSQPLKQNSVTYIPSNCEEHEKEIMNKIEEFIHLSNTTQSSNSASSSSLTMIQPSVMQFDHKQLSFQLKIIDRMVDLLPVYYNKDQADIKLVNSIAFAFHSFPDKIPDIKADFVKILDRYVDTFCCYPSFYQNPIAFTALINVLDKTVKMYCDADNYSTFLLIINHIARIDLKNDVSKVKRMELLKYFSNILKEHILEKETEGVTRPSRPFAST